MARPPKKPVGPVDSGADETSLARAGDDAAQLGKQIAAVEQQFGLDIPYHLDVFVTAIRQRAAESAQRLVEIGRMLIVMRERETRDVFAAALERCGLAPRFAQRAIQTAIKLQDRQAIQQLGVSKALELLSEDDDALDALDDGGTLAGLTLDDIDQMSVRELKAALRAERREHADEKAADEEIIRKKDERINKLTRERARVKRSDAREQATELLSQLDAIAVDVATQIKALRDTASAIQAIYAEAGETMDEEVARRIEQNAQLAADWATALADELGE